MINFDEDTDLKDGSDSGSPTGGNNPEEGLENGEESGEDKVDSWELESDLEE